MTAGPLSALLLDEATADRPVAISGGHVIALSRFRADVVDRGGAPGRSRLPQRSGRLRRRLLGGSGIVRPGA